jgi:hypothetical protein
VLKARRVAGIETLILRDFTRGSFSIARDWTDWADPNVGDRRDLSPQQLDAAALLELAVLVQRLTRPIGMT